MLVPCWIYPHEVPQKTWAALLYYDARGEFKKGLDLNQPNHREVACDLGEFEDWRHHREHDSNMNSPSYQDAADSLEKEWEHIRENMSPTEIREIVLQCFQEDTFAPPVNMCGWTEEDEKQAFQRYLVQIQATADTNSEPKIGTQTARTIATSMALFYLHGQQDRKTIADLLRSDRKG